MSKKRRAGKSDASDPVSRGRMTSRGKARRPAGISPLVWIVAGIVVVAAAAFLLLRPPQSQALLTEISAAQAYEKYQAGAFFLDVRTQQEYAQGHIAKSVLIPLDELQNRLSEVPQDKDVVVVCMSGTRSREGATILRQAGFTRVTCMTGGLQAWVSAGYAVEQ